MKPTASCVLGILLTICFYSGTGPSASASSQTGKGAGLQKAEAAVKAFLSALYSSDAAQYQKCIVPDPTSSDLLPKNKPGKDELNELRQELDTLSLHQSTPFITAGQYVDSGRESYPVGTRTTFTAGFHSSLLAVSMVNTESGWKADIRFWLAMKRLASEEMDPSEPEMKAKAFLFYLLGKRPDKLLEFSATKIDPVDFTRSNDLPGGDLDQVLSLCMEMPVVRARPGEMYRLPSGEVIKAAENSDSLVLVGMMGSIEIAFQMKRVRGEWKVVPQRYFEMLRMLGAI